MTALTPAKLHPALLAYRIRCCGTLHHRATEALRPDTILHDPAVCPYLPYRLRF